MNLKKTLVLSLLLAAAGGYIYYVELPEGRRKAEQDQIFAQVSEERIASIEVKKADGSFVLRNTAPQTEVAVGDSVAAGAEPAGGKGALWRLGEIEGATLDDGALTSLTSALLGLKVGEALPSDDLDKDLSVYGLSSPELEVAVRATRKDGTAASASLLFGKKNDYVRQRYLQVKLDGEAAESAPRIYLVPETLFTSAHREASDFRRKTFISFLDKDVASVSLHAGGAALFLDVDSAPPAGPLKVSKWRIAEGDAPSSSGSTVRASEEGVSNVLRDLRNLKAATFIDGAEAREPATFGLSDQADRLTVAFAGEGKAPLSVRVAEVKEKDTFGRGPGAYISVGGVPTVFFVDGGVSEKLFKSFAELRERQLFRFETDRVRKVDLVRMGGEEFALVRGDGGTWNFVEKSGSSTAADDTFVAQYLSDLASVSVERFSDESRDFGFSAPAGKVTVVLDADGKETAALVVGSEATGGGRYAAVAVGGEALSEPFVLSDATINKILPRRDGLLPVPTPPPASAPPVGAPVGSGSEEMGGGEGLAPTPSTGASEGEGSPLH